MVLETRRIIVVLVILMLLLVGLQFLASAAACGQGGHGKYKGIINKYKKWHPDFIKDSDGTLHIVWQKCYDGQYDIMYSYIMKQKNKCGPKYKTDTIRLTNTPQDSTRPKITIDSSSNIIYILWTEEVPESTTDGYTEKTNMELPTYESNFYYVASENNGNHQYDWSEPKALADGSRRAIDFTVEESEYAIKLSRRGNNILYGTIDTDDDSIKDSDEVLGTLGVVTSWLKKDTDDDGLNDKMEFVLDFDPIYDDRNGQFAKKFLEAVLMYSDLDFDGLTYKQETEGGFPVTVGTANVGNGGQVTYYFYPWATHSAYIELGLQIKRYDIVKNPTPVNVSYSITITVNPFCDDEQDDTYSDVALEGERFKISLGPFDVQMDSLTEVRIEVSVTQPYYYMQDQMSSISFWPYRRMAIWSMLMHAPSPNFELFNYKEPANYIEGLTDDTFVYVDNFEISSDPHRPDLFLEIDYLEGHGPEQEAWSETINAFSDAGILLHYKIDETDIALDAPTDPDDDDDGAETLRNYPEYRDFLERHKNTELDVYIHMIFAHYMENDDLPGWTLYGGAFSAETEEDISHSGVIFADQAIMEITDDHSTLIERRIKVIVHEIGHVLGASHEKISGSYHPLIDGGDDIDDMNLYNVMIQDNLHVANADKLLRGEDNWNNRNLGATEMIGFPRFSIESIDQFDLTNKLSVDTGSNIDLLTNYV